MHLKGVSPEEMAMLFPHTPILVGYRGSIAHHMYVPSTDASSIDDKDVMGVCIAPLNAYFGLEKFEGKDTFLREWDVVVYEVRKFVRLLAKSNPNVLSLLWLDDNHYLCRTPLGQCLIDNRHLFMTRQLYRSFTGYAYGQLKRMTHHAYQGYMGEKRKALVDALGYDAKNAAHLIRLLRMGIEALRTGVLHVARHDAPELLEIKRGLWTLERVHEEAVHLFRRAEAAFDACTLPNEPDRDAINTLLVSIVSNEYFWED